MIAVQRVIPDILSDIVRRQPLSPAKVEFAWRTSVGPALARVSHVRLAPNGTLHVRVADVRWKDEIERAGDLIRARLERLLGPDLRRVDVREGRIATPPPQSRQP